uniref:Uncharacterized protein n=1 Tax=Cacopsylla melanoneura TaxID=428564 RepID=A0A8D8XEP8_9HEMI
MIFCMKLFNCSICSTLPMTLTLSTKLPASLEIMSMKVNSCTPSTPLLSNAQPQNTSLSLLSLKSTLNSLSRLPPSSKLKERGVQPCMKDLLKSNPYSDSTSMLTNYPSLFFLLSLDYKL